MKSLCGQPAYEELRDSIPDAPLLLEIPGMNSESDVITGDEDQLGLSIAVMAVVLRVCWPVFGA
jgi:hypothetical protein